jgi:hypothetical protein
MQRFRVALYSNAEAMKVFKASGGGASGMQAVFNAAQGSGDAFQWFKSHHFGQYASQMALLAGNGKQLGDMLQFVRKENNYLNSSTSEFNSRMDTTERRLAKAKVGFENAAVKAGTAFLPVLTKLINQVTPLIEKISNWISKNPELTATIMKVAAGAAACLGAISGVSFAVSGVMKVVSAASTVMSVASKAIGFLSSAFRILTMVLMANPIILIITAIVAVIAGAAYLIYKYWDQIKAFFVRTWAFIKQLFWKVVAWIKEWWPLFLGPLGLIIKYWDNIVSFFKKLPGKLYEAGKNIILGLWNGIKSMAAKPVEEIKKVANTIWTSFKSILGIASPSRIFVMYGRNIAAGAALGINAASPMAIHASANLATNIIKAPSKIRSAASPNSAAKSGGNNYHFSPTINAQGAGAGVEQDIRKMLDKYGNEFYRKMKEMEAKSKRTDFKS